MGRGLVDRYREVILSGPIIPTFLRLGAPLLVVKLVQLVYTLTDAFWLSRYEQYAVAVPRQVWPTYMLFTALTAGLSAAGLAIVSQYVGAGAYGEVSGAASKTFTAMLASAAALGALYYALAPHIFGHLVRTPPEILEETLAYAEVMAFDIVAFALNAALATILQALGDTRTPALSQALGALANAVLDPLLIGGFWAIPSMGARGAALATVLSKLMGLALLVGAYRRRYRGLALRVTAVDRGWLSTAARVASPVSAMVALNAAALTAQNGLVNSFGAVAATAFSVGFIIFEIADTALWGLSDAVAIMVGQNVGARNHGRAREVAKRASLFIALTVAATAAALYPLRLRLLSPFITGQGVAAEVAEQVIAEVGLFTAVALPSLPFFALTFSAMAVGRGSGHTAVPTAINVARLWGLRIGLGYALALRMNTMGIYVAFAVSNVVGGALSYLWVLWGNWVRPVIGGRGPRATGEGPPPTS